MAMDEPGASPIRSELLEKLRNLDAFQSQGVLAELAYRRAREALEKALEEAREIRLQALEDARETRERELAILMESVKALRQSAEVQIQTILASAEAAASRLRVQGRADAEAVLEKARREAEDIIAEARAIRQGAEERLREVEKLEGDFNRLAATFAKRIGMTDRPADDWWSGLLKTG